jgi:hypothetical protein
MIMKKSAYATIAGFVATGFAAAMLGLAGPAAADVTHHEWVQDIQQQASIGVVSSTIGNGR